MAASRHKRPFPQSRLVTQTKQVPDPFGEPRCRSLRVIAAQQQSRSTHSASLAEYSGVQLIDSGEEQLENRRGVYVANWRRFSNGLQRTD
jgi:hypothetical protein